ncbi:substrate-binding and VWA domain-containing protein [Microtetraspora niveoalba]|uniref:substrate-binding and VWA domain-containing protein n=1 Tax=Microtetraspora niveoalba TaxID=46175 RepID=UPI000B2D82DD|nr:substrate-binding and VWA domain-containing protein [Microtetraspora niveoalba]
MAAAAMVLLLAGAAVRFVGAAPGTCSARDPIMVGVAAAVDIAPPVMEAARRFNESGAAVDGRCVKVEVAEQPPAPVLRTLIGDRAGVLSQRPDGWIADSSAWVRLARKQGARDVATGETVVATSPLVFATSRSLARRFAAGGTAMSWDMVFPATSRGRLEPTEREPDVVRVPDPSVTGAGIATVAAARDIVGTGPDSGKQLTAFVRMAQAGSVPDYRGMLAAVDAPGFWTRPVVVVPEQTVWAHNQAPGVAPVAALHPKEGTIILDYPYVVTSPDRDRAAGARLFAGWLRSAETQEAMRRAGFRTADGGQPPFPVGPDIPEDAPDPRPSITTEVIDEALEAWSRLAPPTRILVLADVSKETAEPIRAGGETRLGVAIEAAKIGIRMFPDETSIGVWEFARRLTGRADERELVGLGSIAKPDSGQEIRRTSLFRVADGIRALPGRTSSLYDSMLAGFRAVSKDYDPLMNNSLLLLTAGKDDGKGISRAELVAALRAEWDPERPVQIIVVAFGAGADRNALNEVVSATNGQLYVAEQPGQIIDVFLSALARRLCHPTCPGSAG